MLPSIQVQSQRSRSEWLNLGQFYDEHGEAKIYRYHMNREMVSI